MSDKIKVLYVDDEVINLKVFELAYQSKFDVLTAKNGEVALEVLEQHSEVDVIITDMKMPRMNGIEFINKAFPTHPDAKYYVLTGFGMNDKIQEAINSGKVVQHIQKPYQKRELERIIRKAMD